MPAFIINVEDFTAFSGYKSKDDALTADKGVKFDSFIVTKADDLKEFKGNELKTLAQNCGMEVDMEKPIKGIAKFRSDIIKALGNVTGVKKTKAAAKPKPPAKPRLGRYIKQGLLNGKFDDMTNAEATALIDKEKADGNIDKRDMEKDTKACLLWYRNNLKDNPKVKPAKVDPEEEAAKQKAKEEKAARLKAAREKKAAEKKAAEDAAKKASGEDEKGANEE